MAEEKSCSCHEPSSSQASCREAAPAGPELGCGCQEEHGAEPVTYKRLALACALALASELLHLAGTAEYLSLALALGAIGLSGLQTFRSGWSSLRRLKLNMNVLMSVAVTGALLIGQWPEAAMVMALFSLAELLEEGSLQRARRAIGDLVAKAPEEALVRQADGSWRREPAASLQAGALLRVGPGERLALDGVIISGFSALNQAPLTGESVPVDKGPGDQVFAGSINELGSFEYRASGALADSALSRLIRTVEEAQSRRAPVERLVDRFAAIYTPAVFILALGVGLIPPLLWAGPWSEWLYKALVLLVIACPCALVISVPVVIVSALAAAARQGLLIKGGLCLEQGWRLKVMALDKTGTLTVGRPEQSGFWAWGGFDESRARLLALSLAVQSQHPLSQALVRASETLKPLAVERFRALPGLGVEGSIDGRLYRLGSRRLLSGLEPELAERLGALERDGHSVVILTEEERVIALAAFADQLKADSRQALAQLRALGVEPVMLSGDNQAAVEAAARQAGLKRALGELLPQDKVRVLDKLRAESRGLVAMVGDGLNDAPALAAADLGLAMAAAGSDAAIETAQVAVMDDNILKLPAFIRLSRWSRAVICQNISLALGLKLLFVTLTFLGCGSMWLAVLADVGVTLAAVANGLRLLRWKL